MSNDLVINGCEVSIDFIKEYETYMESIKDFEYGSFYKVNFTLNDAGVEAGVMKEVEPAEGEDDSGFIKLDEKNAMCIIEIVHDDEGVHQVIITMDYLLEGDKYGTFTWECVQT